MSDVLGVVVPARNEEERIVACLVALARAREGLAVLADPPAVRTVVVADRCTDRTAALASSFDGVQVLVVENGRVGAARAAGITHLLASADPPTWVACTDADSRVPPDWLLLQVEHARAATDLLLGTVRLDDAQLRAEIGSESDFADGHPHVFGAHVGVRSRTYLRVGGFADVDEHEDVRLTEAVRAAGGLVVSTGRSPVITSARLDGRTPGGVAGYLRERLSHRG